MYFRTFTTAYTGPLTFEHLDKIKSMTKIVKEAFVPIGEELRLQSFEVNLVLQKKKKTRQENI